MSNTLTSLTIFFPFFNDAGTVEQAISDAYRIGGKLTDTLEIIALHGGNSQDDTWKEITRAAKRYPSLRVIDKKDNTEGYGVIKHGLAAAQSEWVFYTDGDLQYSLADLSKLVQAQHDTGADVVNGYKLERGDSFIRTLAGKLYQLFSKLLFNLPIRDVDCDFRLIRTSYLNKITLTAAKSSVLPELISKLQRAGVRFAEIPVSHRERSYGRSNYSALGLFWEKVSGDIRLFWHIKDL